MSRPRISSRPSCGRGEVINLANHTALVARDGREIPIEDSAAPSRKAPAALSGWCSSSTTLPERRRTQEALRESEHRYRTLFETMSEGFALHEMLCDEKGRPCDYRSWRSTRPRAADRMERVGAEVGELYRINAPGPRLGLAG